MKLLSPQETRDKSTSEESWRISRINELREAEETVRLNLATADAEFSKKLAENLKEWEQVEAAHAKRKDEMKVELDHITAEQMSIAIPFDILKKESDTRYEQAESLLANVNKREADAEELVERLQNKLDEVEEREENVRIREQKLSIQETSAKDAIDDVRAQRKKAAEEIALLQIKKKEAEKSYAERETLFTIREESLQGKERQLALQERELADRERLLKDGRDVLSRAWKELERKGVHPPS